MTPDDFQDRMVDMLLKERLGNEDPPDVRERVLASIESSQRTLVSPAPRPRVMPLASAKPSRLPVLMAIAAVLVVSAVGVFAYAQMISKERIPQLVATSGEVNHDEGALAVGSVLTTGPSSSAVLTYPDGTRVELRAGTEVTIVKSSWWDRSKGIALSQGKLAAEVSPQPKGSPMIFSAEDARAEVVGTTLSFQSDEQKTRLEVSEGAVRFLPRSAGDEVLVETGHFAESGVAGFSHGPIKRPRVWGITRFTLMNAESDQPIREEGLRDGEVISLKSLPTRNISIRADYDGKAPKSVLIKLTRADGRPTGLPAHAFRPHEYPPFFVAGDAWAEGRPNDCQPWTPEPGRYRLTAKATYAEGKTGNGAKALTIEFRVVE